MPNLERYTVALLWMIGQVHPGPFKRARVYAISMEKAFLNVVDVDGSESAYIVSSRIETPTGETLILVPGTDWTLEGSNERTAVPDLRH